MIDAAANLGTPQGTHVVGSGRKISDSVWMAVYLAVPIFMLVRWNANGALERAPALAVLPVLLFAGIAYGLYRLVTGSWKQRVDRFAGGIVVTDKGKATAIPWTEISTPTVVTGRSTRRLQLITRRGVFELGDGLERFDELVNAVAQQHADRR